MADTPVINYFLASVKQVTRLQPLEENVSGLPQLSQASALILRLRLTIECVIIIAQVFILANEQSYPALLAWAAEPTLSDGFPTSNILKTQNNMVDVAADIAFAVNTAGLQGFNLVSTTSSF